MAEGEFWGQNNISGTVNPVHLSLIDGMDFERKNEKHIIKKKIQDNKLPEEIKKKKKPEVYQEGDVQRNSRSLMDQASRGSNQVGRLQPSQTMSLQSVLTLEYDWG